MSGYFVIKTIPEAITYLPKKEQQEAAWAVMLYGSTGELPQDLSPAVQAIMTFIGPALDNANKQSAVNRENGKRGGRPRKNEEEEQNPLESETKPTENRNETEMKPTGKRNETETKPTENPNDKWVMNGLEMGFPRSPIPPNPKQVSSNKYQDSSIKIQETSIKKESAHAREEGWTDGCLVHIPSVKSVTEIAEYIGVKKSEAKKFYEYYASQGWKFSNGRAVEDIPSALMRWNSRANQFAGKNADGKFFENEHTYTKEQLEAFLVNADNFDTW